jgi:hypothetical protein
MPDKSDLAHPRAHTTKGTPDWLSKSKAGKHMQVSPIQFGRRTSTTLDCFVEAGGVMIKFNQELST